jgi:hypothetical protein
MADYYPLLDKVVSGLKTSTPQSRRAIYDHARRIMRAYLGDMQPPLAEDAIEREARALEAAIARLERRFFHFPPVVAAETPPSPEPELPPGLSWIAAFKFLRLDLIEAKRRATRQPTELDALLDRLPDWLRSEAPKSLKRKRTAKQLRSDLAALGFEVESIRS